jgi:hypothetical protein
MSHCVRAAGGGCDTVATRAALSAEMFGLPAVCGRLQAAAIQ